MIGCEATRHAVVVDPELDEADRYLALAAEKGLRIRRIVDTHTHADHFTAARELGRQLGVPIVMHRRSAAPFVDLRIEDGDTLIVGELRLRVRATPGHTDDSVSLVLPDRVLTGDTLLIGGTGRTDLPTGDPRGAARQLVQRVAAPARRAAGLSRARLQRAQPLDAGRGEGRATRACSGASATPSSS